MRLRAAHSFNPLFLIIVRALPVNLVNPRARLAASMVKTDRWFSMVYMFTCLLRHPYRNVQEH